MKKIILEQVSKRFQREWIFKNLNYEFVENKSYAILGLNGSGKSTLIQCISGLLTPSKGSIRYFDSTEEITVENIFQHISISAPYQELIEEFSLEQMIVFHQKFKKFRNNHTTEEFLKIIRLEDKRKQLIRTFSSGMKQRVKLALAILTDSWLVLLDEPSSNLDAINRDWYVNLLKENSDNRICIICSNHIREEYENCHFVIEMNDYK